jgi:hypothetical protein
MPQRLATFQKAEIEKWRPIIKAANVKADNRHFVATKFIVHSCRAASASMYGN